MAGFRRGQRGDEKLEAVLESFLDDTVEGEENQDQEPSHNCSNEQGFAEMALFSDHPHRLVRTLHAFDSKFASGSAESGSGKKRREEPQIIQELPVDCSFRSLHRCIQKPPAF